MSHIDRKGMIMKTRLLFGFLVLVTPLFTLAQPIPLIGISNRSGPDVSNELPVEDAIQDTGRVLEEIRQGNIRGNRNDLDENDLETMALQKIYRILNVDKSDPILSKISVDGRNGIHQLLLYANEFSIAHIASNTAAMCAQWRVSNAQGEERVNQSLDNYKSRQDARKPIINAHYKNILNDIGTILSTDELEIFTLVLNELISNYSDAQVITWDSMVRSLPNSEKAIEEVCEAQI